MQSQSNKSAVLITIIVLVVLALGVWAYASYAKPDATAEVNTTPNGPITLKGEIVCLPHKGDGEVQTMECAYGLKGIDGKYYGLSDTDPMYTNVSAAPFNQPVEVVGTYLAQESDRYQSIGVINVQSITALNVPQSATITGTIVCLPHKDTTGPQTRECAMGLRAADGLYYALDLSAYSPMAGFALNTAERVRIEGTLVPIEQISTNQWEKYGIKGIISVSTVTKL